MKNSTRIFWKVTRWARAARSSLFALLAVVAYLGIGEARAQDTSQCYNLSNWGNGTVPYCQTRQQAFQVVTDILATATEVTQQVTYGGGLCGGGSGVFAYRAGGRHPSNGVNTVICRRIVSVACPAGTEWNDHLNKCDCGPGTTMYQGQCKTCESLNSEPGFANQGEQTNAWKDKCIAGCMRSRVGAGVCTTIAGQTQCAGVFEWKSSSTCDVAPPDPVIADVESMPEPKKQDCVPAGSGQTFCLKANGQKCYSASTGNLICWGTGETGEKGDGPTLQVKKPGTDTPTPQSMTTHSGDAITGPGDPMTVVTVVNNQLTITTTTANYTTQHGTDAKPTNSGESPTGTDDEETPGTATGGENCDSPPIVGGDAALNMVANQAWATRCAVEAGNAANVTGDVSDCKSPFTVEGTNANAEKLRAMRASICGAEGMAEASSEGLQSGHDSLKAQADALMPGEGDSVFAGEGDGSENISTTRFGGGGGGCPAQGFSLGPIGQIDTSVLCNALAALRMLFLAIATIWAIRIVGGQ